VGNARTKKQHRITKCFPLMQKQPSQSDPLLINVDVAFFDACALLALSSPAAFARKGKWTLIAIRKQVVKNGDEKPRRALFPHLTKKRSRRPV
jgi:hypothetical protein